MALIIVAFVLNCKELTRWLPSKCNMEFYLQFHRYLFVALGVDK
jgi:hypothetical protein